MNLGFFWGFVLILLLFWVFIFIFFRSGDWINIMLGIIWGCWGFCLGFRLLSFADLLEYFFFLFRIDLVIGQLGLDTRSFIAI